MTMSEKINELKTAAEEKYKALKTAETENKQQIETDFHQALSAREQQVKELREDATADDADKKKANDSFNDWYTALTEEEKKAYTEYQKSIEQAAETTNTERADFMNDVSTPNFDGYENLSSQELIWSNAFVREIQKFALALGAENTENRLTDGFLGKENSLTRSRVRAIQTHLNTKYNISWEDLGCKNNTPDGLPGKNTLAALLQDTSEGKTVRETMIAEKATLNLTPIGPDGKEHNPAAKEIVKPTTGGSGKPFKDPLERNKDLIHSKEAALKDILGEGTYKEVTYDEKTTTYTITDPNGKVGTLLESNIVYNNDKTTINKDETLTKIERNNIESSNNKNIIAYRNKKLQEYIKNNNEEGFIGYTGKSGNIYYLENKGTFDKNTIIYNDKGNVRKTKFSYYKKDQKDIQYNIIKDLQNNPEAVVQLIDMATYGPGTNDELLSYLLTNIANNNNFKEISKLYKETKGESLYALLYDECNINSKDNYGFDEYFISFLKYLAKEDHLKSLLLKDNIVLNELKNINEINTYLINNNIERSWRQGKRIQTQRTPQKPNNQTPATPPSNTDQASTVLEAGS